MLPAAVLLAGADGSLLVGIDAGTMKLTTAANDAGVPLDAEQLPGWAVLFSAALIGACSTPGTRQLGGGLSLTPTAEGFIELAAAGVAIRASVPATITFAAELHGLAARRIARSVMTREALERQLAEAGHG